MSPPSTKDRLLAVALDVFAELGYEGTTTREICKRADANVAALNYHWGSKEALWQAACQWAGQCIVRAGQPVIDIAAPPQTTIRRVISAVFDALVADPRPIRIITWASLQSESIDFGSAARSFQPFVRFGMAYFEHIERQGLIRGVDYEVFMALFWGQVLVAFIDEPGHRVYFGSDYSDPAHTARVREGLVASALRGLGLPLE